MKQVIVLSFVIFLAKGRIVRILEYDTFITLKSLLHAKKRHFSNLLKFIEKKGVAGDSVSRSSWGLNFIVVDIGPRDQQLSFVP